MHFVLRLLSVDATASALWIDTVGDFSGARLTTMLPAYDGFETRSALDRFHVSLAFDVETALRILESLSATFAQATDMEGTHQIRMVVIDAITPLLGPSLSATSSQGPVASHCTYPAVLLIMRMKGMQLWLASCANYAPSHVFIMSQC